MNCPICDSKTIAPPPPERLGFSTNLGDGGEPEPAGIVCLNTECKASLPCHGCGQGWVAIECDPQTDWEKTVGSIHEHLMPGNRYIVCPEGHRKLYLVVPEGPSQMDVLMRMAADG